MFGSGVVDTMCKYAQVDVDWSNNPSLQQSSVQCTATADHPSKLAESAAKTKDRAGAPQTEADCLLSWEDGSGSPSRIYIPEGYHLFTYPDG